jgi:hypothetical protein
MDCCSLSLSPLNLGIIYRSNPSFGRDERAAEAEEAEDTSGDGSLGRNREREGRDCNRNPIKAVWAN